MTLMPPEPGDLDMKAMKKAHERAQTEAHKMFLEADTLHKKKELWFSQMRYLLPKEDGLELARVLTEAGILKRRDPESSTQ